MYYRLSAIVKFKTFLFVESSQILREGSQECWPPTYGKPLCLAEDLDGFTSPPDLAVEDLQTGWDDCWIFLSPSKTTHLGAKKSMEREPQGEWNTSPCQEFAMWRSLESSTGG